METNTLNFQEFLAVDYEEDCGLVHLPSRTLVMVRFESGKESFATGISRVGVNNAAMRKLFGEEHGWEHLIWALASAYKPGTGVFDLLGQDEFMAMAEARAEELGMDSGDITQCGFCNSPVWFAETFTQGDLPVCPACHLGPSGLKRLAFEELPLLDLYPKKDYPKLWEKLGVAEQPPPNKRNNTMAEKSIEDRIKDIIVDQLVVNPDQVTPGAKFAEDLGSDSIDHVELIMAFEEEFDIEVPDEEVDKVKTVQDSIELVKRHVSEA